MGILGTQEGWAVLEIQTRSQHVTHWAQCWAESCEWCVWLWRLEGKIAASTGVIPINEGERDISWSSSHSSSYFLTLSFNTVLKHVNKSHKKSLSSHVAYNWLLRAYSAFCALTTEAALKPKFRYQGPWDLESQPLGQLLYGVHFEQTFHG